MIKELELRAVSPTLQLRSLSKHFFEIIKYQFAKDPREKETCKKRSLG